MRYRFLPFCLLFLMSWGAACTKKNVPSVTRPDFSADSAYAFVARQVQMGPRVPGTTAHDECAAYLIQTLERMGASVEQQRGMMTNYEGKDLPVRNIIAHFGNRDLNNRILLAAHYDTRPWSDEETDYDNRFLPIDGANDGASGVGVLLEVARQLGLQQQDTAANLRGIDIIFFDCEDYGTPSFYTGQERQNTWCLGSQLWAELLRYRRETYQFGIVLDMVGAPDATFPKEYYSEQYAHNYVELIWRAARQLGYSHMFVQQKEYPIVDDHYYINTLADIPCVDIIHYNRSSSTGFPFWWHTQQDNMQHIAASTLQAVGEVVMKVIE